MRKIMSYKIIASLLICGVFLGCSSKEYEQANKKPGLAEPKITVVEEKAAVRTEKIASNLYPAEQAPSDKTSCNTNDDCTAIPLQPESSCWPTADNAQAVNIKTARELMQQHKGKCMKEMQSAASNPPANLQTGICDNGMCVLTELTKERMQAMRNKAQQRQQDQGRGGQVSPQPGIQPQIGTQGQGAEPGEEDYEQYNRAPQPYSFNNQILRQPGASKNYSGFNKASFNSNFDWPGYRQSSYGQGYGQGYEGYKSQPQSSWSQGYYGKSPSPSSWPKGYNSSNYQRDDYSYNSQSSAWPQSAGSRTYSGNPKQYSGYPSSQPFNWPSHSSYSNYSKINYPGQ
jgi:hypothetical protein